MTTSAAVRTPLSMHTGNASTEAASFHTYRESLNCPVVARFTVDGEPASKARARFTKRGSKMFAYTPDATMVAETKVGWGYRAVTNQPRPEPDGAYGVVALFFCATRQRRDVDNMLKLVLDALNRVAWNDDNQVVEVAGRKAFVPTPGEARTEILVYRTGEIERPTRRCEHCGRSFNIYPSQSSKKYCNQQCHTAHRREKLRRSCEQCGADFYPKESRGDARFCSRECKAVAGRTECVCGVCGITFLRQTCHVRAVNYCSTVCRDAAAAARRLAAARGVCDDCGGPTSKKSYHRCLACATRTKSIPGVTS